MRADPLVIELDEQNQFDVLNRVMCPLLQVPYEDQVAIL
jgi:hypothetical protein